MTTSPFKIIEVKYAGRYKLNGVIKYTHKEPEDIRAKRIINEVFAEIRLKYVPVRVGV